MAVVMEQQNEVEDPDEYEEDGAEEDEGGDEVGGAEGKERRGEWWFSLCNLSRLPDRFTPSLMKKKKKCKEHALFSFCIVCLFMYFCIYLNHFSCSIILCIFKL